MSLPCSVDALWLWRAGLYGWPWPSLARHGIGVTRNDLFRFGNVEQGKSPGLLVVPAKGVVGVSRMCSVRVRLLF